MILSFHHVPQVTVVLIAWIPLRLQLPSFVWNAIAPLLQFSSVQSLSCVRLFATPWIAARQASLSITNSQSLLKLMSIELVMPSSHLILCRPLLLLPPIPPSIRVFPNESTPHEVARVLEFQLQRHSFQWTLRTDLSNMSLWYLLGFL